MTQKELLKQYRNLVRNIDSFSAGQAAMVVNDEDEMTTVLVAITPSSGLYQGGTFKFELDLSEGFPNTPPTIRCITRVYHPNIDLMDEYGEGDICLNLLDELFDPCLTLEDYVQGLLFLFYNPNLDDPLSGAFDSTVTEEEYHANVRRSMLGEDIDGFTFDRVLPEDYDSESNTENTDSDETQDTSILTTQSEEQRHMSDEDVEIKVENSQVTKDASQTLDTTNEATITQLISPDTKRPVPTSNNWYNTGLWVTVGVTVLTCTTIGLMKIVRR